MLWFRRKANSGIEREFTHSVFAYNWTRVLALLRDTPALVHMKLSPAPGLKGLTVVCTAAGQPGANAETVSALIAAGGKVDERSGGVVTPLFAAAVNGNAPVTRLLLEQGAQVDLPKPDGTTPLAIAAIGGYEEVVALLLAGGASPHSRTRKLRNTPLTLCATAACARLLLEAGADVNAANAEGSTPLHDAAAHGDLELVNCLSAAGGNLLAKDMLGMTPSQYLSLHQVGP